HLDAMEVHVEMAIEGSASDMRRAAQALQHRIKSMIGISTAVKPHAPGVIPRSEGKAKRVFDKRR
ncbi:MAG: phenylacetate--CoA ligase, partial [Haliea sp.]|nr:phenylacetate--CoA ligase [Haliea sp.]